MFGAREEYALHTMLRLAEVTDAPSARELGDFQRIPVPYIRKLLTQLRQASLAEASEGVSGGWRLARPAADISLLDIVDAVSGHQPLFVCADIRSNCVLWEDGGAPPSAVSGTCSIHAVMLAAERSMRQELRAVTLEDIHLSVASKRRPAAVDAAAVWFADRRAGRRSSTHSGAKE